MAISKEHKQAIADEVAYRSKFGMIQVPFAQFKALLREIGYRFDMDLACRSTSRYLTGERAGQSYPAKNLYPRQMDDGKSAFHFEARRDANYEKLKEIREKYFSVHSGCIYGF